MDYILVDAEVYWHCFPNAIAFLIWKTGLTGLCVGSNMIAKRRGSIRTAKGTYMALRMETLLVPYYTPLVSGQSSSPLSVGQRGWWNPREMTLMV